MDKIVEQITEAANYKILNMRLWKIALSVSIAIILLWNIPIPVLLIGALYFLPTILGWNKKNASAILLLNLLLGWTFIGWVVAIVWGATED